MFGLLKVLAAIFHVIEDSTFKTRRDTARVAALKRARATVYKIKRAGLNAACTDSHGFSAR